MTTLQIVRDSLSGSLFYTENIKHMPETVYTHMWQDSLFVLIKTTKIHNIHILKKKQRKNVAQGPL